LWVRFALEVLSAPGGRLCWKNIAKLAGVLGHGSKLLGELVWEIVGLDMNAAS